VPELVMPDVQAYEDMAVELCNAAGARVTRSRTMLADNRYDQAALRRRALLPDHLETAYDDDGRARQAGSRAGPHRCPGAAPARSEPFLTVELI
jgi:hypothetical protein